MVRARAEMETRGGNTRKCVTDRQPGKMVGLSEAMADCHSAVPRLTSVQYRAPGFKGKNKVLKCDTLSRPIPSRLTCKIAHASIEYDENKSYVRNQA